MAGAADLNRLVVFLGTHCMAMVVLRSSSVGQVGKAHMSATVFSTSGRTNRGLFAFVPL